MKDTTRALLSQPTHLQYVMAAANLYAKVFGLEQLRDEAAVSEMASEIILPKFEPQQGVKIAENEEQEQAMRNAAFGWLAATLYMCSGAV